MKFKFVKVRLKNYKIGGYNQDPYDVWALIIENLEQLKEYAEIVAYPKSCLVSEKLVSRMDTNEEKVKKGGYPISGHWGDMLVMMADMEIQKPENENMTIFEIKSFICNIMVDPKQKMIESGQPLITFGFPFSQFPPLNNLEIVEEKILENIPVKFVEYYKTKDHFGILFDVE